MKLTVPVGLTLHATLAGFAENVTAPPGAVAWMMYTPRYVGLVGVVVNRMDCEAAPTENAMNRSDGGLYREFPAWFAAMVQVPTPVKLNVPPEPCAQTAGERLLKATGLPEAPPVAEAVYMPLYVAPDGGVDVNVIVCDRSGGPAGFGVGFGVGLPVGFGVGFPMGFEVGFAVGFVAGFGVAVGLVPKIPPEVGAVGAKLLYPDNTIQHAGVVLGIFGIAGHAFKGAFAEDRIYFDFPHLIRNVSAVTGACMMVPTKKFWACGGFDEEAFPISYNDVDLCLKLSQKGYRILYTPHAQLYHHEAVSKRAADKDPRPAETMLLKARWEGAIECDPFYSPNLTLDAEDYSYRTRMTEK